MSLLLCHPILYNLWNVSIAYLIKQCKISNLVGLRLLQNSRGILTIGRGKSWSSNYMTPLCDNYQTAHFEISSNCLFCGNSDKNYGEKGGYQLILVRIFNFQSMPSMSWRHVIKGMINGSVVSIQEWNISKTSMPRFMFTIFATTKNRALIHAWCWHEKKKSETGLSPGTQKGGVW